MKNKILLLGLVVLGIFMSISLVSAYTPYANSQYGYGRMGCVNCGAMPYNPVISTYYPQPYIQMPVRVGGAYRYTSDQIIGLRPGTYYQTPCVQRPGMYYQSCRTSGLRTARIGGYFGYGGYYGLRTPYYRGYGTGTPNINYMYHGIM